MRAIFDVLVEKFKSQLQEETMQRREIIAAAGTAAALASASNAFAQAGRWRERWKRPCIRRNTRPLRRPPGIVSGRAMTAFGIASA